MPSPSTALRLAAASAALAASAHAQGDVRTGAAAFGDWRADRPGVKRLITPADLPRPGATRSVSASPAVVPRPAGATPQAPPGFSVGAYARLDGPRLMRTAPNGDVFVAETDAGVIRILRPKDGAAAPAAVSTFAAGLDRPFGIAFHPATDPRWVYVATVNSVVRFPYADGDLKARGAPVVVVPKLADTTRGHSTRDLAFSPDGKRLFVSVGSGSNVAEEMPRKSPDEIRAFAAAHAPGAAWGPELDRADVLSFDPEGGGRAVFAAGIRNCVGLAVHPSSHDLWCSTNERDTLGDNLVPDYVTRVRSGAFYGWPWYYIGDHEDPRRAGERPDLRGRVTTPDVLIQSHSASLELAFYPAATRGPAAFPAAMRDDGFAAEHGSWNRAERTGYKVVRIRLKAGVPTGVYEDFLTGFITPRGEVWGRPVGVTVARDGALLVSDDGSGVIWRVAGPGAGR